MQRKNKPKKCRHSNIQTFEMPKTLENKKIHCLEIIEYIYIIVEICQIVSNISKKEKEMNSKI